MLEKVQECVQIRRVAYQHKAKALYNQKAKVRCFFKGEWVMRKIPEVIQKWKFSKQWEGPFEIKEVLGKETYKLTNLRNKKEVARTWNEIFLKKYYI